MKFRTVVQSIVLYNILKVPREGGGGLVSLFHYFINIWKNIEFRGKPSVQKLKLSKFSTKVAYIFYITPLVFEIYNITSF